VPLDEGTELPLVGIYFDDRRPACADQFVGPLLRDADGAPGYGQREFRRIRHLDEFQQR
jgi:hypothetical protein